MNIGRIGIWRNFDPQDDAVPVEEIEALGFGTLWFGGSPTPGTLEPFLARTTTLNIATGIVNIWRVPDAAQVAAETAHLDATCGGRFLLGIGIGHRESVDKWAKPLDAMTTYLDELDAAPTPVPREARIMAALAPKMLDVAAARSLGTHSYFVPPEHTRAARDHLGKDAVVAPELAVVVETNAEEARRRGREYAALYLSRRNYVNNLLRSGFDESDVADGGSDRLIDAIVPHGAPEEIAQAVHAHLDAGADHVAIQAVGNKTEDYAALAGALL